MKNTSSDIQIIRLGNKNYPELLAQIADPPRQLYCRGNMALLNSFCIAVVGTRKLTAYGREAAEHIVSGLAGNNITIVSGLAMGIDAVAHQAALDNDLPTIAVLGSPVDDTGIAPRTNFSLAKDILNNSGLLISEYAKSSEVFSSNYAVRDRIISGLSKGVAIIEGAEKSGSLITAKSALDQNRDVFAVPGSIFSFVSAGTNSLIKSGAKLITSANDILEEYAKNEKFKLVSANDISTQDPVHKKILAILDKKGGVTADEIISGSGLEASQVIATLSILELRGRIKQKGEKYICN